MAVKKYPAEQASVSDIIADIQGFLKKQKLNSKTMTEYELLTEELLIKLIDEADGSNEISVHFKKGLTGTYIIFSCSGKPVSLEDRDFDFGAKIIRDYAERLSLSRKHGINQVSVSLGTASNTMTKRILVAGILSVITCLILYFLLDDEQILWMTEQIGDPVVNSFIKLLQNLATPIAFVSLVAYIINFYDSVEFDKCMLRISVNFLFTSIAATLIAFLVYKGFCNCFSTEDLKQGLDTAAQSGEMTYFLGNSLKTVLEHFLYNNLLEIFANANPLPMLMIAILLGIGINSYSSENNIKIRNGINAVMELLSKLITIIFAALPFFFYIAVVDSVLYQIATQTFLQTMLAIGICAGLVLLVFLLQFVVYAMQLLVAGISPAAFLKKYKDMLLENWNIASNMDALPYNIRAFRRKMKNPEKDSLVRATLNMGANINMDGNCLIITMMIMLICDYSCIYFDVLSVVEMLLIILLLGVGSPNQPGSFTIAMIVLMGFLNISVDLYPIIIIFEGVFCKLYSSVNAFGDIVTVVILADDELKA